MTRIIKSTYYSNWGDRIGYPLASVITKHLSSFSFITPNIVSVVSFILFAFGCISLILNYPNHMIWAGTLIFLGYVGDDVDGQLARVTKKYSVMGDYMDKVLDVLKIFLITFFSGLSVYYMTGNIVYILLGFIACFFFNYRYYIKLETMFSSISRDANYLDRSSEVRQRLEKKMDELYQKKARSIKELLYLFSVKNRTFLFFDEAEFAIIVAIGSMVNRVDISLWTLAIAQVVIAIVRVIERGQQLNNGSSDLLKPLRK